MHDPEDAGFESEPFDRITTIEVAEHFGDRTRLIGRLVEGERGLEGPVLVVDQGYRVAGDCLSLGDGGPD